MSLCIVQRGQGIDGEVSAILGSAPNGRVAGVGLEAQRAAVSAYLPVKALLREHVEVESGAVDDRREFARARTRAGSPAPRCWRQA